MSSNFILPPFGRSVAADDATVCSHFSPVETRFERSGKGLGIFRNAAVALMLLCCACCAMFGQHREYRGSYDHLSALSCGSGSLTGKATDSCTVTLTSAAGSYGVTVSLASSSSAVTVPASVTVASGATSASFTASAAAVTAAQTVTLTASRGNSTETYPLQLKATSTPGTAGLTLGSTSVAFGNVNLNTPSTQTVKLTSSGTASVTISAAAIKGTGFSLSGITTPLTLSAGQTATLDLQFDPTAAGADTGSVTISSNSSSGATATIALSGTGTAATSGYQVELNWDAPSSSTPAVSGYNIYRAPSGSTSYTLLNSSVNQPSTYTDTTVKAGSSYSYEIMSVDTSGVQSSPSNTYAATIP